MSENYYHELPGLAPGYNEIFFGLAGALATAAAEAAENSFLETAVLATPPKLVRQEVPMAAALICRLLLLSRISPEEQGWLYSEIEAANPARGQDIRVIGKLTAAGNAANIPGADRELLLQLGHAFNPGIDRLAAGGQAASLIFNQHWTATQALPLAQIWWQTFGASPKPRIGKRLKTAGAAVPRGRGKPDPQRDAYIEAARELLAAGISKTKAAELLGVSRPTLYAWIENS